MSIADLIRQMSALGAPSEAIALAVEAIEQAQGAAVDAQAKVEEKRAIERDRKRRQRERSRDSHGTVTGQSRDSPRTVTGQSEDSHGTVTDKPSPSPSPLSSPQTPQQTPHPHPHPHTTPARTRGARLPAGWRPEEITGDLAKRIALWPPGDKNNPSAIQRELAKFRDWAASAPGDKGVKSDWQATWRNWLRRADEEGKYRDSRPQAYRSSTSRSGNPDRRDGLAKACDRIIDAHTGGIDGYAFPAEQDRFGDGGGAGRALPAP